MKSLAVWTPTNEERDSILSLHNKPYDGFATMQNQNNQTPLSTQDYRLDQQGMTLSNKGEIKGFSNVGINESIIRESKEMCSECGGLMSEGECMECGYSVTEGDCMECGGIEEQMYGQDIYAETDLDPNEGFDYIEGASNDIDTFEGMHKNLYEEGDEVVYELEIDGDDDGEWEEEENDYDFEDFTSAWSDDDLDIETDWPRLREQYDEVDTAYDFETDGPEEFQDDEYDFPSEFEGLDDEYEKQQDKFDYESQDDWSPESRVMIANLDKDMDDEYDGEEYYSNERKPYNFSSGGPFGGGTFANENVEAANEQKVILEMFERMKKF